MNEMLASGTKLAGFPPDTILRWAGTHFPPGTLALSSSFQTQSLPLLHLVASILPDLPVLFVDTGFHFPETLRFRDQVVEQLGLNLRVLRAEAPPESATAQPLYRTNPDLCCELRKVQPVQQAMREYRGWISGIRRDQSAVRAQAQVIEPGRHGLIRIHPLLDWTQDDVERYLREHDLPQHPLTARGYPSIGCQPCTRPPTVLGDLRSGRWQGQGKTECGLHTRLREAAPDLTSQAPIAEAPTTQTPISQEPNAKEPTS